MKKFGMLALAIVMSLGVLSIGEAAQTESSADQVNYCCRGSYCYNQSQSNDQNCGDYCCNGQRGCW